MKCWQRIIILSLFLICPLLSVLAQYNPEYMNLQGNNSALAEYFAEDENNWNKSIIYVFYNNQPCNECADAMQMMYRLYQDLYQNQFSYFEINYEAQGENNFQKAYNLMQPLSIVLVRINDGMARGYQKIDNPQFWVNDPLFFNQNITQAVNNFLVY